MELKQSKTHRTLTTLSECSHVLIHAKEEQSFLNDICNIIVKNKRYELAYVGYAKKDKEKKIVAVVAGAGRKYNYLDDIEIRWSDSRLGRGTDGTSIRRKEYIVIRGIYWDDNFTPWRKRAINCGLNSVISLPLIIGSEAIGCLTLYSYEFDPFDEEEIDLLKKIAGQISFGIKSIRAEHDRIKAEQELLKSREELRHLAKHSKEIREKERIRIARDIHDDLAQTLSAIKLNLTWVKKRLTSEQQELIKKQKETSNMVVDASEMIQRIISDLRPAMLKNLDLVDSIEWLARDFKKRTGIKLFLSICNIPDNFCEQLSLEIFRIVQEALTNVIRHAKATRLTINMNEEKNDLTLIIKDNGRGISKEQMNAADSYGLMGMKERIAPWEGTINYKGITGKGTTVTITIPLKKGLK